MYSTEFIITSKSWSGLLCLQCAVTIQSAMKCAFNAMWLCAIILCAFGCAGFTWLQPQKRQLLTWIQWTEIVSIRMTERATTSKVTIELLHTHCFHTPFPSLLASTHTHAHTYIHTYKHTQHYFDLKAQKIEEGWTFVQHSWTLFAGFYKIDQSWMQNFYLLNLGKWSNLTVNVNILCSKMPRIMPFLPVFTLCWKKVVDTNSFFSFFFSVFIAIRYDIKFEQIMHTNLWLFLLVFMFKHKMYFWEILN